MSFNNKLSSVLFALIIASSAVVTQRANAGVVVKEKTNYYNVSGVTGKEIFRKFGVKRTSKQQLNFGGRHAIANTDFIVEIKNINKSIVGNNCRIKNADIVIDVTYILPKWTDGSKASANMRKEWKKFMDYVVWHERHHVRLAKDFASEYLRLIKSVKYPALADCSDLPKEAELKLKKLVAFHKKTQQNFDRAENRSGGKSREFQIALKRAK